MQNGEDATQIEEQEIFGFLADRVRLGLHQGAPVFARRITLMEQLAYEDELDAFQKNGTHTDNQRFAEAVVRYLVLVVVDEDGKAVFSTNKHKDFLRSRAYAEIEPLFKRASAFNAFGPADLKGIEKNSGGDLETA